MWTGQGAVHQRVGLPSEGPRKSPKVVINSRLSAPQRFPGPKEVRYPGTGQLAYLAAEDNGAIMGMLWHPHLVGWRGHDHMPVG